MSRIEEAVAKLRTEPAGERPGAHRGALSRRFRSTRETARPEHAYGGRRLRLDLDGLRAQGLVASGAQAQRVADEYRAIKRPLLRNASPMREPLLECGNLLMVTSALGGEGKTFTSTNLALSIARDQDWSIVLVDGDCNKAHLTRLLGAEGERGLMELLREPDLSFDSLVMPTDVPGLSLLPAGRHDEDAPELLASAKMEGLCTQLSESDPQRIVLFDSPPLLLTSEGPALASQAGQIAMVVLANKTPRQAVLSALERLDESKAINLILNQVRQRGAAGYGNYYGYGGGYGGGHGSGSGSSPAGDRPSDRSD